MLLALHHAVGYLIVFRLIEQAQEESGRKQPLSRFRDPFL